MFARLNEMRGGWVVAVVLAIAAFIGLNAALSGVTGVRLDLTENGLYTLSQGTRNILSRLQEPVQFELYVSRRLVEDIAVYGNHAGRVRDVLRTFEAASNGTVTLVEYDPDPFSETEDQAMEAGLQGVPLDQSGERVYFGVVARSGERTAVIPFFQPAREPFLEYDLVRLLNAIADPQRRVIGVITALPLFGEFSARMGRDDKWYIVDAMEAEFEVRNLFDLEKELTDEIDAVLVAHPAHLDDKNLYWLDQYLMAGGRAVILVDPHNEYSHLVKYTPGAFPAVSDLNRLTEAWGVRVEPGKVVADAALARMVNAGTETEMRPVPYLLWSTLREPHMSPEDPVLQNVSQLNFATAGAIEVLPGAPARIEPLLVTTERSQLVAADSINPDRPNITEFIEKFQPTPDQYLLAARISGRVPSAFPDGPPREEPAAGSEGEQATEPATLAGDGDTGATTADGTAGDGAAAEGPTTPEPAADGPAAPESVSGTGTGQNGEAPVQRVHLSQSAEPLNVILIADADMLHQRFWVQVQSFFGQRVAMPFANNGDFIVNALDQLSGSEDLIGLRSRGTAQRPFTRIADMRAAADEQYRQKEQELVRLLQETERSLRETTERATAGQTAEGTPVLTDEQRQAVEAEMEQLRSRLVDIRRQLRDVQHALRRDIERLQTRLQFVNIGLVPVLVALVAVAMGVARIRRRGRAARV